MTKFDHFILLAEMRTGSNLLETNLNLLDGVTCHGEAFNPSFMGHPKAETILGLVVNTVVGFLWSSPVFGHRSFNLH